MRCPSLPWILLLFLVACSREAAEVKAAAQVKPAERDSPEDVSNEATRPASDALDLARQLRDPDLLNQLDEPVQSPLSKSTTGINATKPFVIKGVDSAVPPVPDSRPVPTPPIGKPEMPGSNDTSLR